MFSLLKRISAVPTPLATMAVFGPLFLLFLFKVPDKLARAMGYRGEQSMFALDQHPYTPEATYELLSDYGEAGRRATDSHAPALRYDPPSLLHALLFQLLHPTGEKHCIFPRLWRWAVVLPWLTGGADLLENTGIIMMARFYPSRRHLLARLTSAVTGFKWGALALTDLFWLAGSLIWLLQRLRGQASQRVGKSSHTVSKTHAARMFACSLSCQSRWVQKSALRQETTLLVCNGTQ